jgi:selenocysteine lyase/cysteine desulfurase
MCSRLMKPRSRMGHSIISGIPAVEIGLRYLESVGIENIGERVRCLTGWLLDELLGLRHSNGNAMVHIYGPVTTHARGGTVTLNFYDPDGHLLDYRRVEELASKENIASLGRLEYAHEGETGAECGRFRDQKGNLG